MIRVGATYLWKVSVEGFFFFNIAFPLVHACQSYSWASLETVWVMISLYSPIDCSKSVFHDNELLNLS